MNPVTNQIPQEFAFLKHPFILNKYAVWYFQIMNSPYLGDGYSETHHIIPKAMGGPNAKSNLVRLTAKQHFVAHKLLTRMTTGIYRRKAEAAYRCVAIMKNPKAKKALRVLSSAEYERLRIAHASRTKKQMTKLWKSEEFKAKMSKCQTVEERSARAKKGRTPEVIEAHRQALQGRKHSEETKAKMRAARLKRFAEDPDYRSKCKAGLAKGLEAVRAKMT